MNLAMLIRHHYLRGQGFGLILWESLGSNKTLKLRFRKIGWLVTKYPLRRMFSMGKGVMRWGKSMRGYFLLSFPLTLVGTMSAALGAVMFLLRPEGHAANSQSKEKLK